MSEITRVPLQPVAQGSVTKIWLGVAVAALIGIGGAYAARPQHFATVYVEAIKQGEGESPKTGDVALVNYVGRLASTGKEFDRGERVAMPVDGVIPGFSKGLQMMKRGGKYRLEIPAADAYGDRPQTNQGTGEVVIPANSDLVFEVELIDFKSAAELEQQRRVLQQMQGMQGAPGGPHGAPHGAPPAGEAPQR